MCPSICNRPIPGSLLSNNRPPEFSSRDVPQIETDNRHLAVHFLYVPTMLCLIVELPDSLCSISMLRPGS